MKNIWLINHYASPPIYYDGFRHYKLAQHLIAKGYKVHIFTASTIHASNENLNEKSDKNKFCDCEYGEIKYTLIKETDYCGNGLKRIKNMLGFSYDIRKLWKVYGYENPDIIYVSSPHIFSARKAEKFAKRHNLPCVVEIRDLWPLSIVEYSRFSNSNPLIRYLYGYEKRIYKNADALIFTMEGGKDYIRDKKWNKVVNLDKVFNVNNGLDIGEQEMQRKEFILEDIDLQRDVFKIIYAGSVRIANSIDMIIKAMDILKPYKNIRLIIYGDGDSKKSIEKYCIDNGLNNVVLKGRINSKYIPYVCAQADLNIISVKQTTISKYGVSWNKLFDYMGAGKPIVSTVKPNYDLIEKYNCGISLTEQTPEAIATAILRIYNMPQNEYMQMCENARQAAKDYDYSVLTDKLEEAMQYAIEHHGVKK